MNRIAESSSNNHRFDPSQDKNPIEGNKQQKALNNHFTLAQLKRAISNNLPYFYLQFEEDLLISQLPSTTKIVHLLNQYFSNKSNPSFKGFTICTLVGKNRFKIGMNDKTYILDIVNIMHKKLYVAFYYKKDHHGNDGLGCRLCEKYKKKQKILMDNEVHKQTQQFESQQASQSQLTWIITQTEERTKHEIAIQKSDLICSLCAEEKTKNRDLISKLENTIDIPELKFKRLLSIRWMAV
ncbi:unnamed protein product [Rotaria sordida]|uniref:Uncharacterized protein n=1 Tax=Rotaria sordida TaxID=392033 RepID=A0A814KFU1_9BILA|nr:unnamed protein product [Rotaria sordida]